MITRSSYSLIVLLIVSVVQAQQPAGNPKDTAWHIVKLQGINNDKGIFEYNSLRVAIIWLSLNDLRTLSQEKLKTEGRKEEYKDILIYLDTSGMKKDTVTVAENTNELDYLVSDLLVKGQAKVYSISNRKFIDTVSYRFERYGADGWRFYYLPDKRPFFGILELSGIIDDDADLRKTMGKNPGEYKLLSDKLKRIWKQN